MMLQRAYNWIMHFASHPHAIWILLLVTFAESSVFPIPPDPLFVAMALRQRHNAWQYALFCTIASVVGGWGGYAIGAALYDTLGSWVIHTYGLEAGFTQFQASFQKWGFWIIALKGLTPIPFKIVTIASGVAHLDFWQFTMASVIARAFRFFMLATLLWHFGPAVREMLEKNLGIATALFLGSLALGFAVFKFVG